MGKLKSAVADGVLCSGCGKHLGDAVGYERQCSDCAPYANIVGGGSDSGN